VRVWGGGIGVWGVGVWGVGFGVWGLGLGVQGLGLGAGGLGFVVWDLGFRVQGLGLRVWGMGLTNGAPRLSRRAGFAGVMVQGLGEAVVFVNSLNLPSPPLQRWLETANPP